MQTQPLTTRLVIGLCVGLLQVDSGSAQKPARDSWPQWRGPARTGVLTLDEAPAMWPPELKKGWSVEVGDGYSSPVSGAGRVFVHARRDPDEVVSAIDLATGAVAWTQKPIAGSRYYSTMSRRSTPAVIVLVAAALAIGMAGSPRPQDKPAGLRILFIGNSLTAANDLPAGVSAGTLRHLQESADHAVAVSASTPKEVAALR
jgi:outer membrane protein assembly factor BamB